MNKLTRSIPKIATALAKTTHKTNVSCQSFCLIPFFNRDKLIARPVLAAAGEVSVKRVKKRVPTFNKSRDSRVSRCRNS